MPLTRQRAASLICIRLPFIGTGYLYQRLVNCEVGKLCPVGQAEKSPPQKTRGGQKWRSCLS